MTTGDAQTQPADRAPAWSDDDLRSNPHVSEKKAEKVRSMFAAIAPSYDLNNRLHSFGIDQLWRKRVVRMAEVKPIDRVLDMACGTGDLSRAFAKANPAKVVGGDYTPEMLEIAKRKPAPSGATPIEFVHADATDLPFEDDSFEILSIAFGIRNVSDPAVALKEFARVLVPGGRLLILEFDEPRFPPIAWASNLYTKRIMPITASIISRDRSGAYKYLPKSVESFMSREEMIRALSDAGFADPSATPLTFGVSVCYRATVPVREPV